MRRELQRRCLSTPAWEGVRGGWTRIFVKGTRMNLGSESRCTYERKPLCVWLSASRSVVLVLLAQDGLKS